MLSYQITLEAEADLKKIARYTIQQWGKAQAILYAKLLEASFNNFAINKVLSRTFSDQYPQVRVTKCEHHYIFHVFREGNLSCVLGVLHESMDLINQLKDRLS